MSGRNKWTEKENNILREHYSRLEKKDIECKLAYKRSWASIIIQASKLKIKRDPDTNLNRFASVSKLLQSSNESFYWIGFLLADGHFYKSKKRFKLCLSKKDADHIWRFAKFLDWKGQITESKKKCNVQIACMDAVRVGEICKRFDINNNKTYCPPNLDYYKFDDSNLLSLFIGFIDGDGSIGKQSSRNDACIRVKCHASWLDFLNFMISKISNVSSVPLPLGLINSQGYAQIVISNSKAVRFLKNKTKELSLPCLDRKWSKIDDNYMSRIELCDTKAEAIKKHLKSGLTPATIAEKMAEKPSTVREIIRRRGLKET